MYLVVLGWIGSIHVIMLYMNFSLSVGSKSSTIFLLLFTHSLLSNILVISWRDEGEFGVHFARIVFM